MLKRLGIIIFLALSFTSYADPSTNAVRPLNTLEEIKVAAEDGNPVAQDKMADLYNNQDDSTQAEIWYRKSAGQGNPGAQIKLGNLLLKRARETRNLKPDERTSIGNEGVKWITLAANQGDPGAQASLADLYSEGRFVSQNLIEVYKWGELSTRAAKPNASGAARRDAAILKMDADQIAYARRRVDEFKPQAGQKTVVPTPSWVDQIKLNGISGNPALRLATVGNKTFSIRERKAIKIGDRSVTLECLEINNSSATFMIEGVEDPQTLWIK